MNIKSTKFMILAAVTFAIIFLMNFIGNTSPDRIQNALLIATGGVAGLTIGMWFVYRNSKDDTHHEFD